LLLARFCARVRFLCSLLSLSPRSLCFCLLSRSVLFGSCLARFCACFRFVESV
jgi:hypothetical protein